DGIRDLTVTGVQTCALPIYDRDIARVAAVDDEHPACLGIVGDGVGLHAGVLDHGKRLERGEIEHGDRAAQAVAGEAVSELRRERSEERRVGKEWRAWRRADA